MKTTLRCKNCGADNEIELSDLTEFRNSILKDVTEEYKRKEAELSEELERSRSEIRTQAQNESALEIKSKEKLIADLKQQLVKIKQKIDSSSQSQQAVGEIQELELEAILKTTFPTDLVVPVGKGIKGADCTLHVRTKTEKEVGTILFESKRVQNFNEHWIDKLKSDNQQAQCSLMVIITSTMPKDIQGKFGVKEGVWICLYEPEAIKQMVLILRYVLFKICEVTLIQNSPKTNEEKLFQYINSPEFSRLFENILKNFDALEKIFQEERKKLTMLLKLKEQHLQEMLTDTLEFYGTVKSISPELPDINSEYRIAG